MPSEPAAKGTPQRIGKYQIIKHIATGGMGAVYRAVNVETGQEVALKVLSPELVANPAVIERFRREASHVAKLNHENIVALQDWGETGNGHYNIYYLAMEFVDGIDLQEYIKRKKQLDVDESRRILIQAVKALAHVHEKNIVHRDIKPSNFLITKKDGRPLVKLIDLGLSRTTNNDEFRITRASFTLGTVDYMSPEQARDSGRADIRSDIYSLGCTWYQMLAGQPPFAEGSLTERLYKHIEVEPPDIRQINRKVPEEVVVILTRMLAKNPDHRYQTPAELLRDLENPTRVKAMPQDMLSGLAHGEGGSGESDPVVPSRRAKGKSSEGVPRAVGKKGRGKKRPVQRKRNNPWLWVGVGAIVVAVSGVLAWIALRPGPQAARTQPAQVAVTTPPPLFPKEMPQLVEPTEPTRPAKPKAPPHVVQPALPVLYQPLIPVIPAETYAELERPWKEAPATGPAPAVLVVKRAARPGEANAYPSLAAACEAAPADRKSIIEIQDNGPLFEVPAAVTGRSLVVRAGEGYRPMLAWDWHHPAAKSNQFLSVSQGNLTLENLMVVLQSSDVGPPEPATLFQVNEGAFCARGCSFSVTGVSRSGITVVRLEGSDPTETKRYQCRLDRCYIRGPQIIAVNIHEPRPEVLLERCLLVGGDRPLLQLAGYNGPYVSTLRVARSTLVCDQTLLQIRPIDATNVTPTVKWIGWDALLARNGNLPGGAMVDLVDGANPHAMEWQAVNCFYSGWRTLLAARGDTRTDLAAWHALWHYSDGDKAGEDSWPLVTHPDPAQMSADEYRTAGTPAAFAALLGPGELGCDLTALPATRDPWKTVTYEFFVPPPLDDAPTGSASEIPAATDGLYHGERINLTGGFDLGEYLKSVQAARRLAPRVVLRLLGTGDQPTSPIRVKGSSLMLYFEPAAMPRELPLVLIPKGPSAAGRKALIEVEDGNLEMVRGRIRFLDLRAATLPEHMLLVQGGHLGLFDCHLQGPLSEPSPAYRGLISLERSATPSHNGSRACVVNTSVLISSLSCLEVSGSDCQVRIDNSLVLSGGDGLSLNPGAAPPSRLNVQCILDHTTVAVRGAVLHLNDASGLAVPGEPTVVQARDNLFLAPVVDLPHRAGLLLYEGNALSRGLLIWQGRGNVYDRRFLYMALPAQGTLPEKPQAHALWVRLWGTPGDRQPWLDVPLTATIDLARAADPQHAQLARLALPSRLRPRPTAGADLGQLHILNLPR